MRCPRCEEENPPRAKFCLECGAPLARTCAKCGLQLPAAAKFCPECANPVVRPPIAEPRFAAPETYTPKHLAEKILTSRAALEGERKQVTVLFADLKGSMELLADRDPEEARRILDPVLERMMEAVHRYEGTVNQVMGDGIMALFGAPVAHEDHAVRACYAALRMQDAVRRYAKEVFRSHGAAVEIRVGLNSGEVVVRSIGSDLHMDYTAVGQTTHLAARMEQLASPGSILVTADTFRLAEGYVEVKPRGPVPVKGLAQLVEVYEITGAAPGRTRFEATALRGLTRFVGREAELDQLRKALELAGQGHGQVVAIVGEAGVGKSRSLFEFAHSHRTQGWLILESGSVSYGKATPYLPVIDLLRGYFQIEARDDVRKIREKVSGKLVMLDERLLPAVAVFLALLDVPVEDPQWQVLDPPQRRQRTLETVKRLLLRESQVQPLLLVFEDLHWIDSESQVFLDGLVESLPSARVLLLVNYRPEYEHSWGSKTYYTQLRIDPLPPATAAELLEALLGPGDELAPLKRLLIQQTEGNPFFLEESVRTLVETRVLVGERGAYRLGRLLEGIRVPATVQAVLAARIDRLPPEEKRLLQCAAVIGHEVPFAILEAIAELPEEALRRGLARLQFGEFLYETQLFPDLEYTFKHALTHEVAYGSLLQERRRDLHSRIVRAIEELYPERLVEQAETLAHHALRGEVWEKAVQYLRQAGLKAAGRSTLPDAQVWLDQALDTLEALPESPSRLEQAVDIRLDLRAVLTQLGEGRRAVERLQEADALAGRLSDNPRQGRVCAFLTMMHTLLGEVEEALASGTRAWAIASAVGELDLRILSTTSLEQAYYFRGDYERVAELAIENLAAVPVERAHEHFGQLAPASVNDRIWLVESLAQLGRFAEAAEHEAETMRLAEPTHHAYTLGLAHYAASTLHLFKGDWANARSRIERGISVLRTGNVRLLLPRMVASSAWALAQLGDSRGALIRGREGRQLVDGLVARGLAGMVGWNCHVLGRACLLLGRLDEARSLGNRALESARSQFGVAADALWLLGDIASHPDQFDAESSETHYRHALALAEERRMRPLVAHCHLGLGKLYRRMGKREQAQEHLTTATTMYREMDMRFWVEKAEAEMKELE